MSENPFRVGDIVEYVGLRNNFVIPRDREAVITFVGRNHCRIRFKNDKFIDAGVSALKLVDNSVTLNSALAKVSSPTNHSKVF